MCPWILWAQIACWCTSRGCVSDRLGLQILGRIILIALLSKKDQQHWMMEEALCWAPPFSKEFQQWDRYFSFHCWNKTGWVLLIHSQFAMSFVFYELSFHWMVECEIVMFSACLSTSANQRKLHFFIECKAPCDWLSSAKPNLVVKIIAHLDQFYVMWCNVIKVIIAWLFILFFAGVLEFCFNEHIFHGLITVLDKLWFHS